jgi:ABC-type lipoprotein release transport system permease subunit
MLKSIFTQIWNRKQSNSWIIIELILVFCLTWYITDYFFVLAYNYSLPNCRDVNHTWQINIAEYPPYSPQYKAEENNPEALEANYNRILQTIRNHPDVENIAILFSYTPEGGSYWGAGFKIPDDTANVNVVSGQQITFDPHEDFFGVFRYTSGNGEKPASNQDFDWNNPNSIVIGQSAANQLFPGQSALGKEIISNYDNKENITIHKITGVVDDIKRFDYERTQNAYYLPQRLDSTNLHYAEIAIRSRSSISDALFKEAFGKEMANSLRTGNFYLKNIISYKEIAANTKTSFGMTNEIRIRIYLMVFFLVNILLCVTGTFWYHVNIRKEETGLRKALGSSSPGIRNLLLMEGLCLLALATLPAMLIEYQFVHAELIETLGKYSENPAMVYLPDRTFLRFMITNGITWIIMAIVVIAAVWLPARKAAAMEAATALHYE